MFLFASSAGSGNGVILQDGAKIGTDGYGYAKKEDGSYYKIAQSGIVVLEDDVEVGANSTIDRATIGESRIRRGAKIDNLVQVGHASLVGENTLLCAQVGLAGSTKIGRNVILTGQVGVAGHLEIGDGVVATAQSGIGHDIEPGKVVSGSPEMDNKVWRQSTVFPEAAGAVKAVGGAGKKNGVVGFLNSLRPVASPLPSRGRPALPRTPCTPPRIAAPPR